MKLETEKELAERLGLSTSLLAKLRVTGEGPPFLKIGKSVRYDPVAVDEWLANRKRTSTSEAA